jgi:4-amino-4-deoxy-L-arabinose transferase-like glycosyltransferase
MIPSLLKRKDIYKPALVVFLLGAGLRLYSFYFSSLLFNSDGFLYLQQAKALYLGEFDQVTACYPYPNLYPAVVVPFYWLMGHWVIAAKTVSFVFATASLIPLYFILRHFFDRQIATAVLFLVAVNPFLVRISSEVLRGPLFWFFISLGLALFVASFDAKKRGLFLAGSCLSYVIAAGSRIDAVVFLFATPVFILLLGERRRKLKDLFWFVSPLLLFGGLGGLFLLSVDGFTVKAIFSRDIFAELQRSLDAYGQIRDGLLELGRGGYTATVSGVPVGFFKQCRNLLVWISFADTMMLWIGMAFYPFALFFIFGFKGAWSKLREDVKLRYLLMMGLAGFSVVMLQEIFSWFMSARFIVLSYLPLLVFFGFGLERFIAFLERKKGWGRVSILLGIACICMVVTLPKNLKHNRADKAIFREIGEFVGEREGSTSEIHIAAFFKRVGYANVFANLEVKTVSCVREFWLDEDVHGEEILRILQSRNIDYFVWDEKNCTAEELAILRQGETLEVTTWETKRLGELVLFKFP